eukprot:gene3612-4641_t
MVMLTLQALAQVPQLASGWVILSSTLLTLLVLPILYRLAHKPDEQDEDVSAEPAHPGVATPA